MKTYTYIYSVLMAVFVFSSCSDFLVEKPKSILTPGEVNESY